MDTLGLVLLVVVTAASVQDRDGARMLLECLATRYKRLKLIWADPSYAGDLVDWLWCCLRAWRQIWLEVVRKQDGQQGFAVLPKRWQVEMSHPQCTYSGNSVYPRS